MRLDQLFPAGEGGVLHTTGGQVEVSSLAYDSARVRPGALFFCVPGVRRDGHRFAAEAVEQGAAALVVERDLHLPVAEVRVQSARQAMARAAVRFNDDPTAAMQVIGVTGTNGKTTTAFVLKELLEATGSQCGLLSTIKVLAGEAVRPAGRTTPEAIDLQADFAAMLRAGQRSCAMEVSSHALRLRRVDGVRFAAAIFTNLTEDHLDFHTDMEDYFQAKRSLFVPPADSERQPPRVKVVNIGDSYGRRLASELTDAVTFAVQDDRGGGGADNRAGKESVEAGDRAGVGREQAAAADYYASSVESDGKRLSARLRTPAGERSIALRMPGRFNLENALGALAALHSLGGDLDELLAALSRGVSVPGRFQSLHEGQEFTVLVDYAHTPDSLRNVLLAARELTGQRLICVFGAGGDRDRAKRPHMGAAVAELADVAILTSDNPRSEEPRAIIADVRAGIDAAQSRAQVIVEEDRAAAIARAIALARPHDVVLIAGKGHEQGQELAQGVKIPFDDVEVATARLRALVSGAVRAAGDIPGPQPADDIPAAAPADGLPAARPARRR